MHLIVPFAYSHSASCTAALLESRLPVLQSLLTHLTPDAPDGGDDQTLSAPHERALARALNLPDADGLIPWAALQARSQPGLHQLPDQWAFVSLCHWQINSHHIAMREWPMNALTDAHSFALLEAMQPYFLEDGITLYPDQCGRWLANGAALNKLATASPERVLGRDVKPWMPSCTQATPLRRLQNEMQMLLYTHAVNDERHRQALLSVNSFWLHGSGKLAQSAPAAKPPPEVYQDLSAAALSEDWPRWAHAWQALDAGPLRTLQQAALAGQSVQLTLCGERQSQTWRLLKQSTWQKLRRRLSSPPVSQHLQHL